MKRLLSLVVIIVGVLFLTGCGNENEKLEEIAQKFNSSEVIKSYASMGYNFKATAGSDNIKINVTNSEMDPVNITYNVEDDILSGDFDLTGNDGMFIAFSSLYLIDAIGQTNGYEDGEMIQSLNDKGILDYTLENEGLKITSSDTVFSVKVNINKKIPLIDFSNVYITEEDLADDAETIQNGSFSGQRGNVRLSTLTADGKTQIIIAEKDALTTNTYNTLLTVVKVLFNSEKAPKYIQKKYASVEVGDKEFAGVKIETSFAEDDDEIASMTQNGYKAMKITITQKTFKKNMKK